MIRDEDEARDFVAARCDTQTMERLHRFAEMLAEENDRQNLVSRSSLLNIWQRHIADSVQLLNHVPRETDRILDLGTGAGLPGIILAIVKQHCPIQLVESRRKRVDWLERLKSELSLSQCTIVGKRLELVESEKFDIITARAFAPLDKLLDLSARFSTRDTCWVLPKGRSGAQELKRQPASVQNMFHVEQSLTDADATILVGKGRPPRP